MGGLPGHGVAGAPDQARWDLLAQTARAPLHALLGATHAEPLRLYANNRGVPGRSPEDFAAAAAPRSRGMTAVKCAPFDGVRPGPLAGSEIRRLLDNGLERVAQVRTAVGSGIDVLLDCHWQVLP